jgi:hypothetical protein
VKFRSLILRNIHHTIGGYWIAEGNFYGRDNPVGLVITAHEAAPYLISWKRLDMVPDDVWAEMQAGVPIEAKPAEAKSLPYPVPVEAESAAGLRPDPVVVARLCPVELRDNGTIFVMGVQQTNISPKQRAVIRILIDSYHTGIGVKLSIFANKNVNSAGTRLRELAHVWGGPT